MADYGIRATGYHVYLLYRLVPTYLKRQDPPRRPAGCPLQTPLYKTKAQAPPTKRPPGFGEEAAPFRSEERRARLLGREPESEVWAPLLPGAA